MAQQKEFADVMDSVSSDTVFHKNAVFTKKNYGDCS